MPAVVAGSATWQPKVAGYSGHAGLEPQNQIQLLIVTATHSVGLLHPFDLLGPCFFPQ